MSDLKCPFCGAEAYVYSPSYFAHQSVGVQCTQCDFRGADRRPQAYAASSASRGQSAANAQAMKDRKP